MGSFTPAWASVARGSPIDCVAILDSAQSMGDKLDLQFQSRNVALLRPGQAQPSRWTVSFQRLHVRQMFEPQRLIASFGYVFAGKMCIRGFHFATVQLQINPFMHGVCVLLAMAFACVLMAPMERLFPGNAHILQVDSYIERSLEGFNVNICVLGSTGSGADMFLEGMPGAPNNDGQAQGVVLIALQSLFQKLQKRSLEVWSIQCIMST